MAFMEWSRDLSIGIPIFDDEHKRLLGMINTLHDSIENGTQAAALKRIENELIEYTIVHFRHEEMYFDDFAYPQAKEHQAHHAEMKKRVFAFREEIEHNASDEVSRRLLQCLRDWLADHILIEDKKFGAFLCARGYGADKARPFR